MPHPCVSTLNPMSSVQSLHFVERLFSQKKRGAVFGRHDWDETLLELERLPSSGCGDNCIISYRCPTLSCSLTSLDLSDINIFVLRRGQLHLFSQPTLSISSINPCPISRAGFAARWSQMCEHMETECSRSYAQYSE